ncbi:MAG: 50S ribosomal protein L17 [Lachnospiraceae bacterium]|nr:50S ribosomal protein L17 [Lachnospiraceae bacterium]
MAKYRKLGRTSDQRKALLRNQVTNLLYHGKIVTTQAKAKEVQKIAEGLIALAIKEKDNFETVTVTAKVPRKDDKGNRVKQIVDKDTKAVLSEKHRDEKGKILRIENGVTVTVYDEVQKEIKKDMPSRLHARHKMVKVLYPVAENPSAKNSGTKKMARKAVKKGVKQVDLVAKLFDEYGPRYEGRNGGYTRIVKIGQRKGDAAMQVLLELV